MGQRSIPWPIYLEVKHVFMSDFCKDIDDDETYAQSCWLHEKPGIMVLIMFIDFIGIMSLDFLPNG